MERTLVSNAATTPDICKTLYFWWIAYLRCSSDYWWICKENGQCDDERLHRVWKHFGNIFEYSTVLHYWRERNHEVDFIVQAGRRVTAIEVKSGRAPQAHPGTATFVQAFHPQRTLLVGGDGIPLQEFLARDVLHWVSD